MATQQSPTEINGIRLDVLKETVSALQDNPDLGLCHFRAHNKWAGGNQNETTVEGFYAGGQEYQHKKAYKFQADEPTMLAGRDEAANPVEHLLNAVAACVTTSMIAHAAVRGIHIDQLESHVEGDIDLRGFLGLDDSVPKGYTNIRMHFFVQAHTDDMEKLKELAQFSPVYNTITNGADVDITVEPQK